MTSTQHSALSGDGHGYVLGIDGGGTHARALLATPEGRPVAEGWGGPANFQAVGEEVTRTWDSARDFYVLLEGSALVERDGRERARLGAGDFFGEIAALDWGAGYGYERSATVTAVEPLRLLVLDPAHLNMLMAEAPSVAERVQRAVRARSPAD